MAWRRPEKNRNAHWTVPHKRPRVEQDVNGIKAEARCLLMGTGSILDFKDTGTEPSYAESAIDSKDAGTVQCYRKDAQLILKKISTVLSLRVRRTQN